jgi:nucleoside-diphosphate-sugar epimerase
MALRDRSRKVLITGGTGFVGRACATELRARGMTVVTASRSRNVRRGVQSGGGKAVEHHSVDLFDRSAVKALLEKIRPTDLLHCAGPRWSGAGDLRNASDISASPDWAEPSLALAQEFAAAGGKRMVAIGSCAEYAWDEQSLSEASSSCVPQTQFGRDKLEIFKQLTTEATKLKLGFGWARMFFLFGPGEARERLVSDAINTLLTGGSFTCYQPDLEKDFIFIDDAARAVAEILVSDLSGAVNVGSGRTASNRSIVTSIASLVGREELVKFDEASEQSSGKVCAGLGRLIGELRFQPSFSLRQGLERTIGWWRTRAS